jgi:hypothetical protein
MRPSRCAPRTGAEWSATEAASAFNLINVEGWLGAYVKLHLYTGPYFQFSTIVDRAVRVELAQPTMFFVGLATGVEF